MVYGIFFMKGLKRKNKLIFRHKHTNWMVVSDLCISQIYGIDNNYHFWETITMNKRASRDFQKLVFLINRQRLVTANTGLCVAKRQKNITDGWALSILSNNI